MGLQATRASFLIFPKLIKMGKQALQDKNFKVLSGKLALEDST